MIFLGQKLFVVVCKHVGPCLRSFQLFAVHLFCDIAQVHVDLLALKMAIFSPQMAKKWHFWEMKMAENCIIWSKMSVFCMAKYETMLLL